MALETVVYPQGQYGYICKELYGYGEQESFFNGKLEHNLQYCKNWDQYSSSCNYSMMQNQVKVYNLEECCNIIEENNNNNNNNQRFLENSSGNSNISECCQRKRKRTCNNKKKKEESENQRMIHITVERNRRKQMNEYLNVLRSLMPSSYVLRADQASIIEGAINFVKELEHHHQTLQHSNVSCESSRAETFRPSMTDIEVNLVENHANLKILSKKRPKQLMKLITGLQCLWLTILHLNVITTIDQMVLYSISVKVEEGCQLTRVEEISQAVNQLLYRIQEEATSIEKKFLGF